MNCQHIHRMKQKEKENCQWEEKQHIACMTPPLYRRTYSLRPSSPTWPMPEVFFFHCLHLQLFLYLFSRHLSTICFVMQSLT